MAVNKKGMTYGKHKHKSAVAPVYAGGTWVVRAERHLQGRLVVLLLLKVVKVFHMMGDEYLKAFKVEIIYRFHLN